MEAVPPPAPPPRSKRWFHWIVAPFTFTCLQQRLLSLTPTRGGGLGGVPARLIWSSDPSKAHYSADESPTTSWEHCYWVSSSVSAAAVNLPENDVSADVDQMEKHATENNNWCETCVLMPPMYVVSTGGAKVRDRVLRCSCECIQSINIQYICVAAGLLFFKFLKHYYFVYLYSPILHCRLCYTLTLIELEENIYHYLTHKK